MGPSISDLFGAIPYLFRSLGFFMWLPIGFAPSRVGAKLILAALFAWVFSGEPKGGGFEITASLLEFLVGSLLSLPLALAVHLAGVWGELFDLQRGENISSFYDPLSNASASSTALLLRSFLWVILLKLGILEELLLVLKESFNTLPSLAASSLAEAGKGLLILLTGGLKGLLVSFLPLALLFLIVDLCFGLLAKTFAPLSFFAESFQVKFLIGVIFLLALLSLDDLGVSVKSLVTPFITRMGRLEQSSLTTETIPDFSNEDCSKAPLRGSRAERGWGGDK